MRGLFATSVWRGAVSMRWWRSEDGVQLSVIDAAAVATVLLARQLIATWRPGVMPAACCSGRSCMSAARRCDSHRALARLGCRPVWSCARCLDSWGRRV